MRQLHTRNPSVNKHGTSTSMVQAQQLDGQLLDSLYTCQQLALVSNTTHDVQLRSMHQAVHGSKKQVILPQHGKQLQAALVTETLA